MPADVTDWTSLSNRKDLNGWNDLEIKTVGTRLLAYLNGVKIMDYDSDGVLNDKVHKTRNVGMVGHIALQIHRNDELRIRFKNIQIKEK